MKTDKDFTAIPAIQQIVLRSHPDGVQFISFDPNIELQKWDYKADVKAYDLDGKRFISIDDLVAWAISNKQ